MPRSTNYPKNRKSNRVDLRGQRFGSLVAISPTDKHENDQRNSCVIWLCKCNCGKEVEVSSRYLKRGSVTSCGCYKTELILNGQYAKRKLYIQYKGSAKDRGITFNLSTDDFIHLTSGSCFYCGKLPEQVICGSSNSTYVWNGIDRVDNTKGYDLDNCVSCCKHCNRAKSSMIVTEFKTWIESIYNTFVKG